MSAPRPSPGSALDHPAGDTTFERIRAAALHGFADQGIAGTSVRAVAEQAGVSLGLVQHYFPTKARLRAAVDEHVLRVVRTSIDADSLPKPPADPFREFGHRVTALLGTHPEVLRYVGRAVIDRDPIAVTVVDQLVALTDSVWADFADRDLLRPGIDRTWVTLHSLVLVIGTVMMREPLEHHLPEPLQAPDQLRRWDDAMGDLLRHGLFR
ncbi:TetR/AcrR family transcriptional regulator [Pseudonocardia spinosispora]|uniref:TetR/AcrR family transcriptional regulator n=1 Tax=Pseudonocardia spinosispora TaxID=103441 RepID=UPI00041ACD48|nr:TetR/AcrR family transcriptional regulator [Pseudonocardia spinosispora]